MADLDEAILARGRSLVAINCIALDLLLAFTSAIRPTLTWRIALTGFVLAVVIQACRTASTGSGSQDYGYGFLLGSYVFLWIYTNLLGDHLQVRATAEFFWMHAFTDEIASHLSFIDC
jgi:hypothetical protein